jgi:hypothetical protein
MSYYHNLIWYIVNWFFSQQITKKIDSVCVFSNYLVLKFFLNYLRSIYCSRCAFSFRLCKGFLKAPGLINLFIVWAAWLIKIFGPIDQCESNESIKNNWSIPITLGSITKLLHHNDDKIRIKLCNFSKIKYVNIFCAKNLSILTPFRNALVNFLKHLQLRSC